MDCFYVSVERLLNPSLNGKPVAVGGSPDGRGVVSSASYEARRFGVRSAMPMRQALRLCPELVVVRGSYGRYAEYSHTLQEIFARFSPVVEMASQDEAYLDLSGTERLYGTPLRAAQQLRECVLKETTLPCSLGIARNRIVAKIASDLCKPKGLLWVPTGSEARMLSRLPIERMPGVGHRTAERLRAIGVDRIGGIASLPATTLMSHFGEHGLALRSRALGESSSAILPYEAPKSIGSEETLDTDTADAAELDRLLSSLAERTASRLRSEGVRACGLVLKYRFTDFETHTASRMLPFPVDDELHLLSVCRDLFRERVPVGRAIRLLGVTGTHLTIAEQLDLLGEEGRERRDRLHGAVDAIRRKHGFGQIRRGSSGAAEA
jgi:DNA polymerase-4